MPSRKIGHRDEIGYLNAIFMTDAEKTKQWRHAKVFGDHSEQIHGRQSLRRSHEAEKFEQI